MKIANPLVNAGTVFIVLLSALFVGCGSDTQDSTSYDPGSTTVPSPARELEPIQTDEDGWRGPYIYLAEDQSGEELGEVSAYYGSDGKVRFEAYKGVIVEGLPTGRGDFMATHISSDENPSFNVSCKSRYSESGPGEGEIGLCKFTFF